MYSQFCFHKIITNCKALFSACQLKDMIPSSCHLIPTGRKLKGRGGKMAQGAHKGKVQFQGKKIKFENEEEGEDDTKTGIPFCMGYTFFIAGGYLMDNFLFPKFFSGLALCCSTSVVLCQY